MCRIQRENDLIFRLIGKTGILLLAEQIRNVLRIFTGQPVKAVTGITPVSRL